MNSKPKPFGSTVIVTEPDRELARELVELEAIENKGRWYKRDVFAIPAIVVVAAIFLGLCLSGLAEAGARMIAGQPEPVVIQGPRVPAVLPSPDGPACNFARLEERNP